MKKSTLILLFLGVVGALTGAVVSFYSAWLVYSLPLKEMQGESLVYLAISVAASVWIALHLLKVKHLQGLISILLAIFVGLVLQFSFLSHVRLEAAESNKPKAATAAPAKATPANAGAASAPAKATPANAGTASAR